MTEVASAVVASISTAVLSPVPEQSTDTDIRLPAQLASPDPCSSMISNNQLQYSTTHYF